MIYVNNMICIIILILFSQIVSQALREFVSFETESKPKDMTVIWKSRCTRRYSPGTCLVQVATVWTFEFQLQNCTPRLGCSSASRTNRFNNYFTCMKQCKYLIDLYSFIIMNESKNDTSSIAKEGPDLPPSGRRVSLYTDLEYPQDQQTDTAEESQGDSSYRYLYSDGGAEEVGVVDLDY